MMVPQQQQDLTGPTHATEALLDLCLCEYMDVQGRRNSHTTCAPLLLLRRRLLLLLLSWGRSWGSAVWPEVTEGLCCSLPVQWVRYLSAVLVFSMKVKLVGHMSCPH